MAFDFKVFVLLLAVGIAIYGSYEKPGVDASSPSQNQPSTSSGTGTHQARPTKAGPGKFICQNPTCSPEEQKGDKCKYCKEKKNLCKDPARYAKARQELADAAAAKAAADKEAADKAAAEKAAAADPDNFNPDHFILRLTWAPTYYSHNDEVQKVNKGKVWPAMAAWKRCKKSFARKYGRPEQNTLNRLCSFAPTFPYRTSKDFQANFPSGCTFPLGKNDKRRVPCWPPPHFVLHGLWAYKPKDVLKAEKDRDKDKPPKPRDPDLKREDFGLLDANYHRLKLLMPDITNLPETEREVHESQAFWSYEYRMHGQESKALNGNLKGPKEYFNKMLELYDRYQIRNIFHRIDGDRFMDFKITRGADVKTVSFEWGNGYFYETVEEGLATYFRDLNLGIAENHWSFNCVIGVTDSNEAAYQEFNNPTKDPYAPGSTTTPMIMTITICLTADLARTRECNQELLTDDKQSCAIRGDPNAGMYNWIYVPISNHRPRYETRLKWPVLEHDDYQYCNENSLAKLKQFVKPVNNREDLTWDQVAPAWWNIR